MPDFKAFRHVGVWLIICACVVKPMVCFAATETASTVEIAPGVTQKYSLLLNDDGVARVWVLFTGGTGHAQLGLLDNVPVFIGRGILVDGRGLFLREHTAVAVVDSPSSMPEMSIPYRRSEAYLSSTEKIINAIQAKLSAAKIYLVGASAGSISAISLAARMGTRIAGVAVLSGLYTDPDRLKDLNLRQPLVFVHHAKDGCLPLRFTPTFRDLFHPVVVEDIGVHYAGTCGPYSAHHFHGQEAAVVDVLYQWTDGRPLPSNVR